MTLSPVIKTNVIEIKLNKEQQYVTIKHGGGAVMMWACSASLWSSNQ